MRRQAEWFTGGRLDDVGGQLKIEMIHYLRLAMPELKP